jgi:hypothetical protein
MARITTNTTGTQPVIKIIKASEANFTNAIEVPFVQDLTITNSTGVFSYSTFDERDQRKLTTPADNSISTNIVIDDTAWYGNTTAANGSAALDGLQKLASDKTEIKFAIWTAGDTGASARWRGGRGYINNLAPTVSPDAPVWVSPLEIAVDGTYQDGTGSTPSIT